MIKNGYILFTRNCSNRKLCTSCSFRFFIKSSTLMLPRLYTTCLKIIIKISVGYLHYFYLAWNKDVWFIFQQYFHHIILFLNCGICYSCPSQTLFNYETPLKSYNTLSPHIAILNLTLSYYTYTLLHNSSMLINAYILLVYSCSMW